MQNQNAKEKKIIIEAELRVPLGEIAIHTLPKRDKFSSLLEMFHKKPEAAMNILKIMANRIIGEIGVDLKLKELKFFLNDSDNISHGVAFFKARLKGLQEELKKIAGEDKLFFYDCEKQNEVPV